MQVNKCLTLTGIPARVHDWKLGNRSALDWVVDSLRVKTDKPSGIVNDPNQNPEENVRLIKRVCQTAIETQQCLQEVAEVDLEGVG